MTLALYDPAFQPQLLLRGLSQTATRPLLHFGAEEITIGRFAEMVSLYSQVLMAAGAKAGSRIGMLSDNRPEVLVVTAACLLSRFVLVPMHPGGSLDDHLHVADDAILEFVVYDPRRFSARAAALRSKSGCISLSLGEDANAPDLTRAVMDFQSLPLTAPDVSADEIYRLSYTGGTTGKPKAIIGTHRTGRAVVEIQMAEWEWPSEVRQLVCAPLSHAGAAMFLPTLLRGGSMFIMPGFDALAVLQAIERDRITCVMLVPTMIYALLDHPQLGEFDLSSLETVFYGASAIAPARLREAVERIGPVFFQFYGQVEAPMTVSVLRRIEHDVTNMERLASCGRPVPWLDVRLLDDDLNEVPGGEPGEICVRGPLVMAGYLDRPEQTAATLAGGWLHTGDIAVVDSDGFLRIVDRKKEMIVTGGFNVYPREIEDVLASHPSVASCAVFSVPDDHWGEAVTAAVVLRAGAEGDRAALVELVRTRKGSIHAPKNLHFIDVMPLTAVDKPDKRRLRADFTTAGKGVDLA